MIRSCRIAFVGDPHLDASTPSTRIDDYSEATLQKLESLKRLCAVKDLKCVVLLGDVFNKNDQSNIYLNRVVKMFKSFKEMGIYVYSIVGNHDIVYGRSDTIDRSPLQMLFTTELVHKLEYELVDVGPYKVGLFGCDYPDSPIPLNEQENECGAVNCLVLHRFYEYAFGDTANVTAQDCFDLGYQVYACGHDHMVYDVHKTPQYWVIRPGSFMRTNSLKVNLQRDIFVDVIEFKGTADCPLLVYSREKIPSRPSNEVFSASVLMRDDEKELSQSLNQLHDRVSNLLVQMEGEHSKHDIFKTLDQVCDDPEVKQCIETYLNLKGYVRQ